MAKLDVAAKAEMAHVLPSLVFASHLERVELLPGLTRTFHPVNTLGDTSLVQLTLVEGEMVTDH